MVLSHKTRVQIPMGLPIGTVSDTGIEMKTKVLFKSSLVIAAIFLFAASAWAESDEETLKSRVARDKKDYAALTALGNIRKDKGDRKAALKLFKDAIRINPDYPMARLYLGKLYFLMQKPDEAVRELRAFK